MPKLHIVYDPNDLILTMPAPVQVSSGCKVAVLSVPENIKSVDMYHLARRLAELLVEQIDD